MVLQTLDQVANVTSDLFDRRRREHGFRFRAPGTMPAAGMTAASRPVRLSRRYEMEPPAAGKLGNKHETLVAPTAALRPRRRRHGQRRVAAARRQGRRRRANLDRRHAHGPAVAEMREEGREVLALDQLPAERVAGARRRAAARDTRTSRTRSSRLSACARAARLVSRLFILAWRCLTCRASSPLRSRPAASAVEMIAPFSQRSVAARR